MSGKLTTNLGDAAQTKNILTNNINTTTITDYTGSTGLVGQVLSSSALGIDWIPAGGGVPQDLQSVCSVGNQTNTSIIMTNEITIASSNITCPIHIGDGIVGLVPNTIAIGNLSGGISQSANCISIGNNAGNFQGLSCVAIGEKAGQIQGISGIAIGNNAGNSQSDNAIAVGNLAGNVNQGAQSISIGAGSGQLGQEGNCVAIGFEAGNDTQKKESIAIGFNAGFKILAQGAVAIGAGALINSNGVGVSSVAIGRLAMDTSPLFDNNIIINATGASFPDLVTYPVATGGRCYIGTIAQDDGTHVGPLRAQTIRYDSLSGELFWS